MTHRKAYDNHFEDLVKCLPLDDARFIIKLPRSLLPGDTEGKIEAKPTKAEKSLYFLSTVIKPALDVGDTSTFDALISVMENCGFNNVMKVVEDIKSEIVNFDAAKPTKRTRDKGKRKRSTSESSGDTFEPVKRSRKRSSSESNDGKDEKVFSKSDGKGYGTEKDRDEKKKAVCIVDLPTSEGTSRGTGFFGSYNDSLVLVTNYHVIISGLDREKYHKAKIVTEDMKQEILKHVNEFYLKVEGKKFKLSKVLKVEGFCKMSSNISLDYFIIQLDEDKLEKELPDRISTINLDNPASVSDNDQIHIFQHPRGGPLSSSTSPCQIIELHKSNRTGLLIYRGGTDPGSSGGPILKQVNEDLMIVGLHRGGYKDNWDGKNAIGFNFGSRFSDIIDSMKEDYWHPRVPDKDDIDDREYIYRALKHLK